MIHRLGLLGGRGRELPAILERPRSANAVRGGIVLAHGAGGSSQTPFIVHASGALITAGWAVLRFDFGYVAAGGRPSRAERPDSAERADYRAALAALVDALPPRSPVIAAGKSYGGRIATFLVAQGGDDPLLARVHGVLVFGYPIAPPSGARPADVDALRSLGRPALVVQGSRDALGPLAVLESALAGIPDARIAVVEGGDHSYRAAGGRTAVARLENEATKAAVEWLSRIA